MKMKRLKNKLCVIGLIAAFVLSSLSGINMKQYKEVHAASVNNILKSWENTTLMYDLSLSSGDEVTVYLSRYYLDVVFPSGESCRFEEENQEALDTCVVDEEEELLHIVTSSGKYYCMNPATGSYMRVYKNKSNGLYSPESGERAYEVTVSEVKTDVLYIEENVCTLSGTTCLTRWMNKQEYDYIYADDYDPSDIAPFTDTEIITGGNGSVEGNLSNNNESVKVVLEGGKLSITVNNASYTYNDVSELISVAFLDTAEDLIHAFGNSTAQYICVDLRTGKYITVYNDSKTGQYCPPSFENAVLTKGIGLWKPSRAIMHYLSSADDGEKILHRFMTRYEYNQINGGYSPADGTVVYNGGEISYEHGTKRKILCTRKIVGYEAYGLDQYGTVWFAYLTGSVYWYNEEIANEVKVLGGALRAQPLQKNGSIVSAAEFCWNSSHSVITGYYDGATLIIEELPDPDELKEIIGLNNQPTEAPDDGTDSNVSEATATPDGGSDDDTPADPSATPDDGSGDDYDRPEPTYPGGDVTSAPTDTYIPDVAPAGTLTPAVTPAPVKTPQSSSATGNPNKATATPKSTKKPTSDFYTSVSSAKKSAVISVASSIKKAYGKKKFNINAITNSDGRLTYKSSNQKVVTVDDSGNVTIKGCGTAKITIQAMETNNYRYASKTVAISIVPAKLKNFKAKSKSPGKITFTWKKQKLKNAKCQIQASSSAKFTSTRSVKPSPKLKKGKYVAGGLKRGSAYYFRARVVLKVSGKTYYSDWVKKKARIK